MRIFSHSLKVAKWAFLICIRVPLLDLRRSMKLPYILLSLHQSTNFHFLLPISSTSTTPHDADDHRKLHSSPKNLQISLSSPDFNRISTNFVYTLSLYLKQIYRGNFAFIAIDDEQCDIGTGNKIKWEILDIEIKLTKMKFPSLFHIQPHC